MKHMNIVQFNSWAKTNIVDQNKFDDNEFIIMENNHNYKSTGIIAEEVMDKNSNIKKFNYFNYGALSKRFMKVLLDKMEKY